MSRKIVFANNIRSMLAYANLTRREAARQWGMKYDVLNRWSSAGLGHQHPKTLNQLRQLATVFGFKEIDQLWIEWMSPLEAPDSPQVLANDVRDRITKFSEADQLAASKLIRKHLIEEDEDFAWLRSPQVAKVVPQVQPEELTEEELQIQEIEERNFHDEIESGPYSSKTKLKSD